MSQQWGGVSQKRPWTPVILNPNRGDDALLNGSTFPGESFEYFWAFKFDVDELVSFLNVCWQRAVTDKVTSITRRVECEHAELAEFVFRIGLPKEMGRPPPHLTVVLDRETHVRYMHFRHNRWRINSVLARRHGTDACCSCGHNFEDRVHIVFECHKYEAIRQSYCDIFPYELVNNRNLVDWLAQDQTKIAYCINALYETRFS